ncbi:sarcoglycan delta [Haematobia irritans]|uniref:sarcoglycan delta n=1 Tax=Haematobia irritans TaxID=7368 RepID=UPI003F50590D
MILAALATSVIVVEKIENRKFLQKLDVKFARTYTICCFAHGNSKSRSSAVDNTNDVSTAVSKTMNSALGMQHNTHSHSRSSSILPLPPPPQSSLPSLGNNRKSNGYAINGSLLQTPEILSQTSNASTSSVANTTVATLPQLTSTTTISGSDLNRTELRDTRTQTLQHLQQNSEVSTFVFTSPTSTFKRKKQQQLQREGKAEELQKQYEELHTNNNLAKKEATTNGYVATKRPIGATNESATTLSEDYSTTTTTTTSNSKGSPASNSTLIRYHWGQQHQQTPQENSHYPEPQQQHRPYYHCNKANDTKTVINTSTGVIITDTAVVNYASSSTSSLITGGNGTATENCNGNSETTITPQRTTRRTHTLPLVASAASTGISKAHQIPSSFIADGVVDLVHDTKCATGKASSHPPTAGQLKSNFKAKTLSSSASTSATKRQHHLLATTANNSRQTSKQQQHHQHLAKMQASSSGGSGTTTTAKGFSNSSSLVDDIEMNLGLIGWRKKCLYTLLVLLMLLIIINLGLTLWILKVMEFTTEGMGPLKIVPGGIQLTGQALIMDMLRASSIRSRHGQPISIESSRNFSINTRGPDGLLENHLFLGHDKLECLATSFRINDTNGRNLFSVNRDEVTIGAHALRVEGEGGAIFRESIQTPHVRAEPGRELRLESPTRQLEMKAAQDINLQSRAGGIEITALEDIKLTTLEGSIRLESSKIFMPNLRTVPSIQGPPQKDHTHRVFQLCACSNGKLFLASSHSSCAGDDSTVCR